MNLVRDGVKAHKDRLEALIKINEAEQKGNLEDQQHWNNESDRLQRLTQSKLDTALDRTARAYGFRREGHGTIQNGPMTGKEVAWEARYYDEGPHFLKLEGPAGNDYVHLKQMLVPGERLTLASTMDDGAMAVRLDVFKKTLAYDNPGYLATIIYHETVHYERLIDPEVKVQSKEQEELIAYKKELDAAGFLKPPDEEIIKIRQLRDESAVKFLDTITGSAEPVSPYTRPEDQEFNKLGFETMERARREIADERRELADKIEARRREEEEAVDKRRKTELDRFLENLEDERRKSRWRMLGSWTSWACRHMNLPTSNDYQEMRNISRDFLLNNLVVLLDEEFARGLAEDGGGLSSCQMKLIATMRQAPGPLDSAWLLDKMEHPRTGGKLENMIVRIIGGISLSIETGAAEIVKSIIVPFTAKGKGEQDRIQRNAENRDPQSRERGEGPDRTPRDGAAQRQLRGVASGRGSFD